MGFLGFLRKTKEKKVLKPYSELEFPPMPSELLGEEEELEIPSPPESIVPKAEKVVEPASKASPVKEIVAGVKEAEKELKILPKKAIYVKADKYKLMLGEIRLSKSKLTAAEEGIERLAELKLVKDKEFEKWRESLEDIQRKLIFIDKTLFGG